MTFYKRDMQVAEIQMGTPASRLEDACAPDHFDINKLPFVTLLGKSPIVFPIYPTDPPVVCLYIRSSL